MKLLYEDNKSKRIVSLKKYSYRNRTYCCWSLYLHSWCHVLLRQRTSCNRKCINALFLLALDFFPYGSCCSCGIQKYDHLLYTFFKNKRVYLFLFRTDFDCHWLVSIHISRLFESAIWYLFTLQVFLGYNTCIRTEPSSNWRVPQ